MVITHFANILLSNDFPMGRAGSATRKKGDWYHSIAVFTDSNIFDIQIGEYPVKCKIIHFYGEKGSPVLSVINSKISCMKEHKGKKLYKIHCWSSSYGVIGDVRTHNGFEPGYGNTTKSISEIIIAAYEKWGNDKIPYAHQHNEAYNCVGFVDDILSWAENDYWNLRIEKMHIKYGLYVD